MVSQIKPIENSYSLENQLEYELMQLFIQLFDDNFGEIAEEIGFYGMPHIGPFKLIERNVTSDGLAVLRKDDEAAMRYLFKAWRYKNPQRGLHFLNLYLRILITDVFFVTNQLWQAKAQPYPMALKTAAQIAIDGENIDDYYLTSRIEITVEVPVLTKRVIESIRTAIAARFTLDFKQGSYVGGGEGGGSGGGSGNPATWGTDSGIQIGGVTGATINHHARAEMLPAPP